MFLVMLTCVAMPAARGGDPPNVFHESTTQIMELGGTQVDTAASIQDGARALCKEWSLNADQARRFIQLSKGVDLGTYIHYYDTAPCKVAGKLLHQGRTWEFAINGSSKVVLTSGDEVRYMACSAPACEALSMWYPGNDSAAED